MHYLLHLERWYSSQCDDQWEHAHGLNIYTTHDPGWILEVSIKDTELDGCHLDPIEDYSSESDGKWYYRRLNGSKYEAAGDPFQLSRMVRDFLDWAESAKIPERPSEDQPFNT